MKAYHVIAVMLAMLCLVGTASAAVYNFPGFSVPPSAYTIIGSDGGTVAAAQPFAYTGFNHYSPGVAAVGGKGGRVFWTILPANPSTYWAATYTGGGGYFPTSTYAFFDSGGNYIGQYQYNPGYVYPTNPQNYGSRIEFKYVGGDIHPYVNGTDFGPAAGLTGLSAPPSYFGTGYYYSAGFFAGGGYVYYNNVVIGGTDHSVVTSIPSNWTIRRDLLNPSANGLYSYNPNTDVYSLFSSDFYVEADTDTTDGVVTENLVITNVASGTVINTTVLDSQITYHNIKYNVTQLLSSPNAVDGLYSVGMSGSANKDYFWIVSNGAAVHWNQNIYNMPETATLTYNISSGYYDIANYQYYYKILNAYGEAVHSGYLNTQTGTFTQDISTTNGYSQGVYYAEITSVANIGGAETVLAFSPMTVTTYLAFNGYVYNAETGAPINGATVWINQSSTNNLVTTPAAGNYSVTGYGTGSAVWANVSATGYRPYNYSFTPLVTGNKTLNFTLIATTPTTVNSSIFGVIHTTPYGNPIPVAHVWVQNTSTSEYCQTYSNGVGYYLVDNSSAMHAILVNGRPYSVWGDKYGFTNSTFYTVTVNNGTEQPIWMAGAYNFTLHITDSTTNAPIPVVTVVDSLGQTYNTANGSFFLSYPYSTVIFYISSTGYVSKSASYVIDSDMTQTVQLVPETAAASQNTWYSPHQVRFKILDSYGAPISSLPVNATAVANTLPSNGDLQNMYGINPTAANEMLNNTLVMQGITGNDGAIVFTMLGSIGYNVKMTNPTRGGLFSTYVMPIDSQYNIWVNTSTLPGTNPQDSVYLSVQNTSLWFSEPNVSYVRLGINYTDTSGKTTKVNWFVTCASNNTLVYTKDLGNPGTGLVTDYIDIVNKRGYTYTWRYEAVRET